MNLITSISDQPRQTMFLNLGDGTRATLSLTYSPMQLGWFADVSWDDTTINGLRVTSSPNILRQWRKVFPFGLAVFTKNLVEPLNQSDFALEVANMYLLTPDEVLAEEADLYARG